MSHHRAILPILVASIFMLSVGGCGQNESKTFDEVPALDEVKLKQTLSVKKYAMIEFGGRHCIPCKKMQPILSELAKEYGNTISIANVFVQERMDLGRQYKIHLIPTQVIFDRMGQEIFRHTGFWEKSEILTKWRDLKIL